jgi:hypothetical protein
MRDRITGTRAVRTTLRVVSVVMLRVVLVTRPGATATDAPGTTIDCSVPALNRHDETDYEKCSSPA